MRCVNSRQLAQELELDEEVIFKQLLEVVEEEKNNPKKHFIVNERDREVYSLDSNDFTTIRNGPSEALSFVALAEKLGVNYLKLNWILTKLSEQNAVGEQTLKYYLETKEKPQIRLYFEPEEASEGQEIAFVVELYTEMEISQPKYTLNTLSDLDLIFEPTLPSTIYPGRRIDTYRLLGLRHGSYDLEITTEGLIEGQMYNETHTITLQLKSLPPKLTIQRTPSSREMSAVFNKDLELKLRISNAGKGEAQNTRLVGLEEYDLRVLSGANVGIVNVRGRIDHSLMVRPTRSGDINIENLKLSYEDGDGNQYEEVIGPFTLKITTLQPELKLDLDTKPSVESDEIFPLTMKITNIGRGVARNISVITSLTPNNARLQGPIEYSRRQLPASSSDTVIFQIKAPVDGEILFETTEVSFMDEEDKSITFDTPPLTIPVRAARGRVESSHVEWPFIPGEVIKKYHILEEIGEGGFSKAYLVEDTVMNQKRALKALKSSFVNDPMIVEDFIQEAIKTVNLRSPNIIAVHDADKHEYNGSQFPYIVMEYISGGTLRDKMIPGQPLEIMESCYAINDICYGLIYAHQQKIIHCDIKPSNIFYDEQNVIWKLGDFGMAKIMKGREALSSGWTLGYMAPEAQNEPPVITEKSDIYSLGVVFREMLTGSPRGELDVLTKSDVLNKERADRIIDIIERMTSRNPEQRPDLNEITRIMRLSTLRQG